MSTTEAATPALGKREKNKLANRTAILKAGLEVFSTIGYDSATITDVVKASGLSVGTFYNYYGDKDSVFSELVSDLLVQIRQGLSQARDGANSLEDFIMDAYRDYARLISKSPGMQSFISKNINAFRQFVFGGGDIVGIIADLENDMNEAIKKGLLPDFPVRMMTSAMIGAGAEVFTFDSDYVESTAEEKAEFLGNLFVGGIQRLASLR